MRNVIILGKELDPNCSMDEFQEQAKKLGLGHGVAISGYSLQSNLKYGDFWEGGEYHVSGDYLGKKVEKIEFMRSLKWGMEKKTIWKKHWWYV